MCLTRSDTDIDIDVDFIYLYIMCIYVYIDSPGDEVGDEDGEVVVGGAFAVSCIGAARGGDERTVRQHHTQHLTYTTHKAQTGTHIEVMRMKGRREEGDKTEARIRAVCTRWIMESSVSLG